MPFRHVFGQVFPLELAIALAVFTLLLAVMAAAIAVSRRKRRRGEPAARREHWHVVEGAYGVALAGIAVFLIVTSFSANSREFPHDPSPAVTVDVTGYQWCWKFHYAGSPVTVIGACQQGRPPVLVLPAGEPVRIDLTSADVLHAFWVPYLDFKMDAFPGHVDTFAVTFPHPGRWIGRCAQLCGLDHTSMDFWVQAMPAAAFGSWLRAGGGTAGLTAAAGASGR
jgi:cytochrome c oxidase subunit 2